MRLLLVWLRFATLTPLEWILHGMVAVVSCHSWTPWRWKCQSLLGWLRWTLELFWVTSMQYSFVIVWMSGKTDMPIKILAFPFSKDFDVTANWKLVFAHVLLRFQFIPQMIFLNSLFGYLSLLIIVKWCTGSQADLYHILIYMFLSPTDELGENQLFPGQKITQVISRTFFFKIIIISFIGGIFI